MIIPSNWEVNCRQHLDMKPQTNDNKKKKLGNERRIVLAEWTCGKSSIFKMSCSLAVRTRGLNPVVYDLEPTK